MSSLLCRSTLWLTDQVIREFKDFVNKGNVITIAVGLVMALYFQKIVQALLDGVINPIVAAVFGQSDIAGIGFDIGDARISIGLVIDAIIAFFLVAFFLFLIVKAYNAWKKNDPNAGPSDNELLAEIRDLLARREG